MFHVKHWDRHDGPAVTAVALSENGQEAGPGPHWSRCSPK